MKRLLLFATIFLSGFIALAQLTAPVLTGPLINSTGNPINVRLTWYPSLGGTVTGYDCEIDIDSNFSNPVSLQTYGASAVTSELNYNTQYFWRARGKNSTSTSPWSGSRFTTFFNQFTGMAPASPDRNPDVILTWDTVSGSDSYTVEISKDSMMTAPNVIIVPQPQPSLADGGKARYNLNGLEFGTAYYWRIRTEHSQDISGWSNVVSFSVQSSVAAISPSDNAVGVAARERLTCVNTNGILEYQFEISNDSNFNPNSTYFHTYVVYQKDFPPNAGGTKPSISVFADYMSFGTEYFWRIRGVNVNSVSQWSDARSFTTIDAVSLTAPPNNATSVSPVETVFRWVRVVGCDSYIMELDTMANFSTAKSYTTLGDTGISVTLNLSDGSKEYFWRVRAEHFRDSSNWSQVFSFTTKSVGISENNGGFELEVYPNPADDVINLNLKSALKIEGNLNIEIYSILGKLLDRVNYGRLSDEKAVSFNVSNLESGVYMLVVDFNGTRKTHRLSVK